MTFSCGPASSAVTSKCTALRPFLPRTTAGVLTRLELLVSVNSASAAPSPGLRKISQTAVPPGEICRWAQLSPSADDVTCAADDSVIRADFVTVPIVAEIITHPFVVGDDVNGNAALMEPAGTLTEAGRLRSALVELKVTTDGLAEVAVKVTVHVPPWPGATAVGEQAKTAREDEIGERAIGNDMTRLSSQLVRGASSSAQC